MVLVCALSLIKIIIISRVLTTNFNLEQDKAHMAWKVSYIFRFRDFPAIRVRCSSHERSVKAAVRKLRK